MVGINCAYLMDDLGVKIIINELLELSLKVERNLRVSSNSTQLILI